jgi:hypothetical protein
MDSNDHDSPIRVELVFMIIANLQLMHNLATYQKFCIHQK